MPETVIIGGGRIGGALAQMGPARLLGRGAAVPQGEGPIYVCTRNDDLDDVLEVTPAARRPDLVFVQNGMLQPWLRARGLLGCTQALLYFAVDRRGAAPVDGGGTVAWGPWAEALVARLAAGGVSAEQVSADAFARQSLEKLLWSCVLGLLCEVHDAPVGAIVDAHRDEVEALTAELAAQAEQATGARLKPGVADRLCAYSRTIPSYQGAVKEWPWRNGWFVSQGPTPLHQALLARVGR